MGSPLYEALEAGEWRGLLRKPPVKTETNTIPQSRGIFTLVEWLVLRMVKTLASLCFAHPEILVLALRTAEGVVGFLPRAGGWAAADGASWLLLRVQRKRPFGRWEPQTVLWGWEWNWVPLPVAFVQQ